MKTLPNQTASPSAFEQRQFSPPTDLFPELLTPIASACRGNGGAPRTPPVLTGQCARVFDLINKHQPLLSFIMTADHAIPEAAARIHDLRAMGFNIVTTILPEIEFRGCIRRSVAQYSIGTPAWPRPGFLESN